MQRTACRSEPAVPDLTTAHHRAAVDHREHLKAQIAQSELIVAASEKL
jgi:hypothetical protein